MAYAFVADDFTGASDTLATLARGGLRARLFLDVPDAHEIEDLDAWGIATNARSLSREAIGCLGAELGARMARLRPQFVHVKICSTFDSSVDTGNFVALADALGAAIGARSLAVIGGQPSLGRYSAFGTLFARAADGAIHRIDRHPVMSCHPVTPMGEADLIRHLAALGLPGLSRVGPDTPDRTAPFPRFYDALEQGDVEAAGRDLAQAPAPTLVLGASSVAEAWLSARGAAKFAAAKQVEAMGPVLAFAGSRSSLTAAQIAAADDLARLPASPADLDPAAPARRTIVTWAGERLARGQDCLIFLSAGDQRQASPSQIARDGANLVAEILRGRQVGGLVVAGGDTSSAIVQALAPRSLDYAGTICPGVPVLVAQVAGRSLPMALKGGQMGERDFFGRAIAVLRGREIAAGAALARV